MSAKGKEVALTFAEYCKAVVDLVNADVEGAMEPSTVECDTGKEDLRCSWCKLKYRVCCDFFQLCPPKHNAEAMLVSHAGHFKHQKGTGDRIHRG